MCNLFLEEMWVVGYVSHYVTGVVMVIMMEVVVCLFWKFYAITYSVQNRTLPPKSKTTRTNILIRLPGITYTKCKETNLKKLSIKKACRELKYLLNQVYAIQITDLIITLISRTAFPRIDLLYTNFSVHFLKCQTGLSLSR